METIDLSLKCTGNCGYLFHEIPSVVEYKIILKIDQKYFELAIMQVFRPEGNKFTLSPAKQVIIRAIISFKSE